MKAGGHPRCWAVPHYRCRTTALPCRMPPPAHQRRRRCACRRRAARPARCPATCCRLRRGWVAWAASGRPPPVNRLTRCVGRGSPGWASALCLGSWHAIHAPYLQRHASGHTLPRRRPPPPGPQAALTAAREAQPFALVVGTGGTEGAILQLARQYHREYCKVGCGRGQLKGAGGGGGRLAGSGRWRVPGWRLLWGSGNCCGVAAAGRRAAFASTLARPPGGTKATLCPPRPAGARLPARRRS